MDTLCIGITLAEEPSQPPRYEGDSFVDMRRSGENNILLS